MRFSIIYVVAFISFVTKSHSGVPLKRNEAEGNNDSEDNQIQPLYDANDKVISVSFSNLKSHVFNEKYAKLLEFYNSFCGHCKRFAPEYKKLAEDMWPWRDLVKVMAIDCATDENNNVCREYEIMAYPTVRYFSPLNERGKDNLGDPVISQDREIIKNAVAMYVMNDTKVPDSWPDFSSVSDTDKAKLFSGLPENIKYVISIFNEESSALAAEMILQFNRVREIRIRRITSPDIAAAFSLQKFGDIAVIDRNSNIEKLTPVDGKPKSVKGVIEKFLKDKNLHDDDSDNDKLEEINQPTKPDISKVAILEEVKKNKPTIYLADLESAIRYTIFHEITKFADINGERLLALQRYISAVKRYNPLGENAQKFLKDVEDYIMLHNQEIHGEDLQKQLQLLETKYSPIFSSSHWIGCLSSKPRLRGFTCGLWQFFHFMTVAAAEDDKSSDPLEVLQAIHGYVKYFFGCTECSKHFQEMAARRKMYSTANKDGAMQWFWSAHNEVNQRLAGDETEDPEFPKIQFPTKEQCGKCYRNTPNTSSSINEINWDGIEVINFLKHIYGPENISRFGIDNENVLPPTAEKLREKRMVKNVFSDMDMRMGILLYIFCIGMMVIAVKLFLYKGYRKKAYAHDFLGKA